jgi:hypothetical protein
MVCFLSQGHFSRRSSIIVIKRSKATALLFCMRSVYILKAEKRTKMVKSTASISINKKHNSKNLSIVFALPC